MLVSVLVFAQQNHRIWTAGLKYSKKVSKLPCRHKPRLVSVLRSAQIKVGNVQSCSNNNLFVKNSVQLVCFCTRSLW